MRNFVLTLIKPPLYNLAVFYLHKNTIMRYHNLRYGNPHEFAYYVQGMPIKDVARRLRRSELRAYNMSKEAPNSGLSLTSLYNCPIKCIHHTAHKICIFTC